MNVFGIVRNCSYNIRLTMDNLLASDQVLSALFCMRYSANIAGSVLFGTPNFGYVKNAVFGNYYVPCFSSA